MARCEEMTADIVPATLFHKRALGLHHAVDTILYFDAGYYSINENRLLDRESHLLSHYENLLSQKERAKTVCHMTYFRAQIYYAKGDQHLSACSYRVKILAFERRCLTEL